MLFSSLARTRQRLGAALLSLLLITTAHAATDEIVYFHTDANGSPTAAFNEAGEVCWTETYSPYGEKLDNEDSLPPAEGCGLLAPNDVGYTGHVQDNGSGLVYAQQRYYDPQIGRFMSTDPVMPHAGDPRYFGRYHYGANNPYRYVDPTGEGLWDAAVEWGKQAWEGVTGAGDGEFNGSAVTDALASGYNGNQGALGFASTLAEDILTVVTAGEYAAAKAALAGGSLAINTGVRFGQSSISNTFAHGPFKGQTIGNVAAGLKSGTISPNQLPVDVVVRDGVKVALNNRSLAALRRAGMQPTRTVDRTGSLRHESLLDSHLRGIQPSTTIRVRGAGARASSIQ